MTTILYVEDNPQNMRLMRKMLHVEGYTMLEATDGASGIALAEREQPGLILIDISLPDIDGMETANRIKQLPALKQVPIIALTAVDQSQLAPANGDYDGVLHRPITRSELMQAIAYHLSASAN